MKTSPKEKTIPSVVRKKIIPAKRSEVFDAWTKPEIMQEWFKPAANWAAEAEIDLRVGGGWSNDMIDVDGAGKGDGKTNAPGTCNHHTGEYLEIKPPERIVFTWNTTFVQNTRVTVELRDLGGSTELTLTHELLDTEDQRKAHAQGWTTCLDNLAAYFKG
jgi:uncharacterized protein YndB with AHSA1/START domain